MDKETYRVIDFKGLTKLLVYNRRYNPDGIDAQGNRGCYDDCISIKHIGDDK